MWPRVVCKNCGADVAVRQNMRTVDHQDGRKPRLRVDEYPRCKTYRVDETDPTLRKPRQIEINYRAVFRAQTEGEFWSLP